MIDEGLEGRRSEIVTRLRARRTEIVQAMYARIQESVPGSVGGGDDDPAYQAGVLAVVMAILDSYLEAMEQGPAWSARVPPEAVAQAQRAARAGVSSGTVLRRYVAGHGRLGEFVAEEAGQVGLSSNGSALHCLRRTHDVLLERVTAAIQREYDEDCAQMAFQPEQRRTETVRRLLADQPVDPADLAELGYELQGSWHLGVIAKGTGARDVLRRVTTDLGYQLLPASSGDGTLWAWLGAPRRLKTTDVERLLAASGPMCESFAIGGLGTGLNGWRQTHREARGAFLRPRRTPEKVVRYADKPLLAAALEDQTLATWLRGFLAPLLDRPDRGAALLQTLRVYIDTECNSSCAASALKVRRQTAGNRLRLAEKLLGRRLGTCLTELDVAIDLVEIAPADLPLAMSH